MLKELLALNEDVAVSREMQTNINRTTKAVKAEIKRYSERKEQVELTIQAPNKATYLIEINRYMHPEDIVAMHKDLVDAIRSSDENGHIHSVEDTGSTGEHAAEAVLTGLRKGMKVLPEAFFPTVQYTVTWKQIVSRGKK
jgi:hypothetical protein